MSSNTGTATATAASATGSLGAGSAQSAQGITLVAFVSALVSSLAIFGVQMLAFILLKDRLARIFKPKTYLVPERERTEPPPRSPWGWLWAIFRFRDREIIKKCGLDAYFFLRYLQTLLIIFVPLAIVLLPVILPINYIGGRGGGYALEHGNSTGSQFANVTGLDQVAWGNVRPTHTRRYWAHLALALVVIIWVCAVFFAELRVYIKVRQDYLTSAEHRLRASATTVLVSAVPKKWLTDEALRGLYDVFPGGIRNIWINRKFDDLLDKIRKRDAIFKKLEAAETELVKKAKKAQRKQLEKDDKYTAKHSKQKPLTKEEREQKLKREDMEAEQRAHAGGVSSGNPHQVPGTIDGAIDEEEQRAKTKEPGEKGGFKVPVIGGGLAVVEKGIGAVGQGLGKGLGAAGNTVAGGAHNLGKDLETTHGFVTIDASSPVDDDYDEYGRYIGNNNSESNTVGSGYNNAEKKTQSDTRSRSDTRSSSSSREDNPQGQSMRLPGNTTRKGEFVHGETDGQDHGWWKFWKGPTGGFASPIPTGYEEGDEFPLTQTDEETSKPRQAEKKGFGTTIVSALPFFNKGQQPIDYPLAYDREQKENAPGEAWHKFLKAKDRPSHRLAIFSWTPGWLPGLPLINKKVDTIYWCRKELARLNLEIEIDQQHPERFPLMNSAFIQFNHQVAAHMACQAVTHHVPKHMAPRTVEIAPKDVLWDNMSIKWWEAWARIAIVFVVVAAMIILWAFPVAWTATLSQLSLLAQKYSWLHWLEKIPKNVLQAIAGILPALVLSILLALVPAILSYLAFLQGSQTGTERQRSVQNYYFAFLFVQVFLIVSISGGLSAAISSAKDITSIPETLATQLPKAANYFFSYMILQALSTASGTLLQIVTLITWYILPKLFDSTAREKWTRNTTLPSVTWGTLYPVYTNFACIALIYSVVAPIIIVFALITFTLLWIAHRYNMLYVSRFQLDTGGLLYPRAINQTFTGLYVMELCLIGLFLLVRDEEGNAACVTQAIIMIVAAALTILYQYLLNLSFGPLFRHLPITFEDEAVLRDEAFERVQARRLGLEDEDVEAGPKDKSDAIELARLTGPDKRTKFNPVNIVQGAGSWTVNSGRKIKSKTFGGGDDPTKPRNLRKRKHRDQEAQQKISDALYGGIADDIEDLTPDERDVLVRRAFQHYALRARKPTIWIPGDDIGVSDDEVRKTREFAGQNIWISNVGAALDGKCRVVYGRNPPDFSEIDIINL